MLTRCLVLLKTVNEILKRVRVTFLLADIFFENPESFKILFPNLVQSDLKALLLIN